MPAAIMDTGRCVNERHVCVITFAMAAWNRREASSFGGHLKNTPTGGIGQVLAGEPWREAKEAALHDRRFDRERIERRPLTASLLHMDVATLDPLKQAFFAVSARFCAFRGLRCRGPGFRAVNFDWLGRPPDGAKYGRERAESRHSSIVKFFIGRAANSLI
jgi:hypothetical protein